MRLIKRCFLALTIIACLPLHAQEGKLKKLERIMVKGDTLKATIKLNTWIEKDPDYAPYYWERAMLKLSKGDELPALIDLNTYSSLGGNTERAGYYKGLIQLRQGNYPSAIRFFDRHLTSFPDDVKAMQKRALCIMEMKHYEEALSAYAQVLKITPYDPKVLYNTGLCAYFAEHRVLADSLFMQAHMAAPLDPLILLARGLNLHRMGQYEQSALVFKKLTTLEPDNAKAWYNLGVNYYFLDRNKEACEVWQRAMDLKSLPAGHSFEKYCSEAGDP